MKESEWPAAVAGDSACSRANRTTNPQNCLLQILSRAVNKDLFWFGTPYRTLCPTPETNVLGCANSSPGVADSIVSRLFYSVGIDANLVKKYIDINFTSPAGTYSGCGNSWTAAEKEFTVDPLSDEVYHPWEVRMQPSITWDAEAGKLYTLIVYDVGSHIHHGVFINIEGGDLSNAEAIVAYRGPLTAAEKANVYTFWLYEQAGHVNLTDDWRTKLTTSFAAYNMSDLRQDLQLTGPVGLNWLLASADGYSIGTFLARRILNNCPLLYTRALWKENRFFAKRDLTHLQATLSITYNTPSLAFPSCCTDYTYSAKTFQTNLLGNTLQRCGDVRSSVAPSVAIIKRTLLTDAYTFAGTLHTLIMIDLDVPNPLVGTETEPLLHWQIINIPNGTVELGETVQTYRGPAPPDNTTHTYYYLLYQQNKRLNVDDMGRYVDPDCPESVAGRCLFNLALFVLESASPTTPQGANWIRAENDEYIRYTHIQNGGNEEEICADVDGYDNPCPVDPVNGATRSISTCNLLATMLIFTIILLNRVRGIGYF
ncbi:Phosphatidylethanolamine-binding-like protein [Mizuhopecten yessoensis]|uniref:Phosphatidylethanolamine-binding-like protein n=1 Tax=Mizuhopecten yessoensis TaxID=6573 RepID=A0A210R7F4_MIZYE|nr:Phosphatidylethanolamine-binding-like protein [Mizuhopecten yessoensis]